MLLDPENAKHAKALERLEREIPIWLTTVREDGQPQSSPVWFWWDGEVFHLMSEPDTPKVRNMTTNPRVSLHLQADETGDEDILIVEGVAAFDADGADRSWEEPYVAKHRSLIESYGWTAESMTGDYSVRFHVTPTRFRVE